MNSIKRYLAPLFVLCMFAGAALTATITNWSGQISQQAPQTADVILMQSAGVTKHFTAADFAAFVATNSATLDAIAAFSATNPATVGTLATNFVPATRIVVVSGTGGALTNYTILATNAENVIAVKTNVSVRAAMLGDPLVPQYWSLQATNLSGADWLIEFSPVTNSFRFQGSGGTNAPNTLTNGTAFIANARQQGSNVQVSYTFFAAP